MIWTTMAGRELVTMTVRSRATGSQPGYGYRKAGQMSKIKPHEFVPPEPGTRDAEYGWCAREDCGSAADSYAHASEEERRKFGARRDGSTDPCINDSERREAGHTAAPVIRIPLAGVPSHCPFCGIAAAFPLTVFGNQVSASCPACFRIVAPVAVTGLSDARS